MPEYLTPGVYIEESRFAAGAIDGVGISAVAIVGATPSGPTAQPVRVDSFADYLATFAKDAVPNDPVSHAARLFFANGGRSALVVRIAASRGRKRPSAVDAIGERDAATGIHALDTTLEASAFLDDDVGALLTPDVANLPAAAAARATKEALAFCKARRLVAFVELPKAARSARDPVAAALKWAASNTAPRDIDAVAYFPWLAVAHPSGRRTKARADTVAVSPNGALAGIYARSDAARGVWQAPAGLDAGLRGIAGLTHELDDAGTDRLAAAGINAIRRFTGRGTLAWGARSFAPEGAAESEWRYLPVRRAALYIERSLDRGLSWTVFEPNDEPLWAQIRLAVSSFLNGMWRAGAFRGTTPRDAWFVRCDRSTTTQADIAAGRVNLVVGFAPLKPAEFVILDFAYRTEPRP